MPTKADAVRRAAALLAAGWLAACSAPEPALRRDPTASSSSPAPPVVAAVAAAVAPAPPTRAAASPPGTAPSPAPAPAAASGPATLPAPVPPPRVENPSPAGRNGEATANATLELLAFHERVREMSAGDLAREAARLAETPSQPRAALALAIVLAQTHNPGDLPRALALIEPIARSVHPSAAPWQPFARWLAARYAEQRRLEEQLERQTQLLRDQQRRLDQLGEKLDALKAIERSIGRSTGRERAR